MCMSRGAFWSGGFELKYILTNAWVVVSARELKLRFKQVTQWFNCLPSESHWHLCVVRGSIVKHRKSLRIHRPFLNRSTFHEYLDERNLRNEKNFIQYFFLGHFWLKNLNWKEKCIPRATRGIIVTPKEMFSLFIFTLQHVKLMNIVFIVIIIERRRENACLFSNYWFVLCVCAIKSQPIHFSICQTIEHCIFTSLFNYFFSLCINLLASVLRDCAYEGHIASSLS